MNDYKISKHLSNLAEEVADNIWTHVMDDTENGTDIETSISERRDNYLNVEYGVDVFNDYSQNAIFAFIDLTYKLVQKYLGKENSHDHNAR